MLDRRWCFLLFLLCCPPGCRHAKFAPSAPIDFQCQVVLDILNQGGRNGQLIRSMADHSSARPISVVVAGAHHSGECSDERFLVLPPDSAARSKEIIIVEFERIVGNNDSKFFYTVNHASIERDGVDYFLDGEVSGVAVEPVVGEEWSIYHLCADDH